MEYNIEMGNVREDYNIYYKEGIRQLVVEVKLKHSYISKPTIIIVLNSLKKWDSNLSVTLDEFHRILVRVYTYAKNKKYDVFFE